MNFWKSLKVGDPVACVGDKGDLEYGEDHVPSEAGELGFWVGIVVRAPWRASQDLTTHGSGNEIARGDWAVKLKWYESADDVTGKFMPHKEQGQQTESTILASSLLCMPGMQWERQVGSGARWLSAADTTEIAELLQARVREQEAKLYKTWR